MKISYNWLKEYVNIKSNPAEVASALTMSGSEVDNIEDVDGDKVMELEITSNRPVCLYMIGMAREAATVFNKDLKLPEIKVMEEGLDPSKNIECVIKNKKLCPKYTARIITSVEVSPVSKKIKKKLSALGIRTVNNIVDVTNFCLIEIGQPLHVFDLDKITGNRIIVREAVKGEKLVTIDETERDLEPGMLVIADESGPIAVAGVMGGKYTEVTSGTKNILLESAYFDPASVRRTARTLGLSSDSSYRFERGVDKGMVKLASDRASEIITKETNGKIGKIYEAGDLKIKEKKIVFSLQKANAVLGLEIAKPEIERIFTRLGMRISDLGGNKIEVTVPTFREDISKDVDLIEEAARIHGYDKVPGKIRKFVPQVKRKEHMREVKDKLYEILPALGLNEIMTYSIISEAATNRFNTITEAPVFLKNPLSEEQKILTAQLLDGMLKTISWNLNRKNKDLMFFEIGKVYSRAKRKSGFSEEAVLCIGMTGLLKKNWKEKPHQADIYYVKGIVEETISNLKLKGVFVPSEIDNMLDSAEVGLSGRDGTIGFIGEVKTDILDEYDIDQPVYVAHIKLDTIIEQACLKKKYEPIARFPFSVRDISILCNKDLQAVKIHEIIKKAGGDLVRDIELKDIYQGKQVPLGKKSLAYSVRYGIDTRTLTDDEIEDMHAKIKSKLQEQLGVTFR